MRIGSAIEEQVLHEGAYFMEDSSTDNKIASLRQQLETEYATVIKELKGLATNAAPYDSINAHIQHICHYQQQLAQYVSSIEAAQIVSATYARVVAQEREHMSAEEEPGGGLWMLTYEDGFFCSWFTFYASSQEEAIAYARQLIAQLPYEVTHTRLQAYSSGSYIVL